MIPPHLETPPGLLFGHTRGKPRRGYFYSGTPLTSAKVHLRPVQGSNGVENSKRKTHFLDVFRWMGDGKYQSSPQSACFRADIASVLSILAHFQLNVHDRPAGAEAVGQRGGFYLYLLG